MYCCELKNLFYGVETLYLQNFESNDFYIQPHVFCENYVGLLFFLLKLRNQSRVLNPPKTGFIWAPA